MTLAKRRTVEARWIELNGIPTKMKTHLSTKILIKWYLTRLATILNCRLLKQLLAIWAGPPDVSGRPWALQPVTITASATISHDPSISALSETCYHVIEAYSSANQRFLIATQIDPSQSPVDDLCKFFLRWHWISVSIIPWLVSRIDCYFWSQSSHYLLL